MSRALEFREAEAFTDEELFEEMSGSREGAAALAAAGGPAEVLSTGAMILRRAGADDASLRRWQAAVAFARRASAETMRTGERIDSLETVVRALRPLFLGAATERFAVVLMDHSNRTLGVRVICEGGPSSSRCNAYVLVRTVMESGASAVLLVHNHPSGETAPSPADIEVTKSIGVVLGAISIRVVDHIIIGGGDRWTSFQALGLALGGQKTARRRMSRRRA